MGDGITAVRITPAYIASVKAKSLKDVAKTTGLSEEFLKEIIHAEDHRNEHYKCNGVNTIGIGHNMDSDPEYKALLKSKKKIVISNEKVYTTFAKDLLKAEAKLDSLTNFKYNSLHQGKKEALLDVSFNIKPTTLAKSKLINNISNQKINEAVKNFTFINAGSKVAPGLCIRRIENIFDYSKDSPTMAKDAEKAIKDIVIKAGGRKDVLAKANDALKKLKAEWAAQTVKQNKATTKPQKVGLWGKIKNWFKNLF